MTKKVLIFESDADFAAELSEGLAQLGCTTTVVDDASVGLQTAASEQPDLILLSIELPRMNGFSVCNKLKRDASLKGVPLIIMSSDSTDETFEQHRRLRTRAEDYVHKPISFDGLFKHVQQFVNFDAGNESEATELEEVLIEDDLEIEDAADEAPTRAARSKGNGTKQVVDEEVDNFTEQAFGALLDDEKSLPSIAPPADATETEEDLEEDEIIIDDEVDSRDVTKAVSPEMQAEARRVAAAAAPSDPVELLEVEQLEISEELESLPPESAPSEAAEAPTLMPAGAAASVAPSSAPASTKVDRDDEGRKDAEIARLNRELDELKAKLASGKGGGSARDFLDLREQLNKKEKEVLELRVELNHREKEVLALKDSALSLERLKADLSDKLLEHEKRTHELQKLNESFQEDKQQALKRAEDFKRKTEKYRAQLDSRAAEAAEKEEAHSQQLGSLRAELSELQTKYAEVTEKAQADAAAAREAADQAAAAHAEAQAGYHRELEQLKAQAQADQEKAVASREAELKDEHNAQAAALHRAHEEALAKVRTEFEQALKDAELKDERKRHDLATQLTEQHKAELASRETSIRTLEGGLVERDHKIADLEAGLSAAQGEVETKNEQLAELARRLEEAGHKWTADKASLDRAKDALAAALAQIEEAESRELK